jgi:hypothetical protein
MPTYAILLTVDLSRRVQKLTTMQKATTPPVRYRMCRMGSSFISLLKMRFQASDCEEVRPKVAADAQDPRSGARRGAHYQRRILPYHPPSNNAQLLPFERPPLVTRRPIPAKASARKKAFASRTRYSKAWQSCFSSRTICNMGIPGSNAPTQTYET